MLCVEQKEALGHREKRLLVFNMVDINDSINNLLQQLFL